jgi:hypothetical protein
MAKYCFFLYLCFRFYTEFEYILNEYLQRGGNIEAIEER